MARTAKNTALKASVDIKVHFLPNLFQIEYKN